MMKRTQNAGDLSEGPPPFSVRTRHLKIRHFVADFFVYSKFTSESEGTDVT
jgi:hypothetical protein